MVHHFDKCPVVDEARIGADKDTLKRADELIKEAFRIIVRGTKITRIIQLDCLPCRAQYAIMHIVGLLAEQAGAYRLDADLTATLDCTAQGIDNDLPDDLRKEWERIIEESDAEPWVTD